MTTNNSLNMNDLTNAGAAVLADVGIGSAGSLVQNYLPWGDFTNNPFQEFGGLARVATSADFVADMWAIKESGAVVFTISRSENTPSSANVSDSSIFINPTTADNSLAAGDYGMIKTFVPMNKVAPLLGANGMTLSFWVYSTITGTACVQFLSGKINYAYVAEYTITSSNTWEEITINVPVPGDVTTTYWNDTTAQYEQSGTSGAGMWVSFVTHSGTTGNTATANSWQTGASRTVKICTSNQINMVSSNSNAIYLYDVRLVPGNTMLKCQKYSLAEMLAVVGPYIESTVGYGTGAASEAVSTAPIPAMYLATQYDTTSTFAVVDYKYTKVGFASPTITITSPSTVVGSALWFDAANGSTTRVTTAGTGSNVNTQRQFRMLNTTALEYRVACSWVAKFYPTP